MRNKFISRFENETLKKNECNLNFFPKFLLLRILLLILMSYFGVDPFFTIPIRNDEAFYNKTIILNNGSQCRQ
jgi:hypothetical protein